MSIILKRINTEKTSSLLASGIYSFFVPVNATKNEIVSTIEKLFEVKVKSIRTSILFGKNRSFKGSHGRTSSVKKVYVSLATGMTINFEKYNQVQNG